MTIMPIIINNRRTAIKLWIAKHIFRIDILDLVLSSMFGYLRGETEIWFGKPKLRGKK